MADIPDRITVKRCVRGFIATPWLVFDPASESEQYAFDHIEDLGRWLVDLFKPGATISPESCATLTRTSDLRQGVTPIGHAVFDAIDNLETRLTGSTSAIIDAAARGAKDAKEERDPIATVNSLIEAAAALIIAAQRIDGELPMIAVPQEGGDA